MKTKLFILITSLLFCCSVHSQSVDIDKMYNDSVTYYDNYLITEGNKLTEQFKDKDFNKLHKIYYAMYGIYKMESNKSTKIIIASDGLDISDTLKLTYFNQINCLLRMYVISWIIYDYYEDIWDTKFLAQLIVDKEQTLLETIKSQLKLKYNNK